MQWKIDNFAEKIKNLTRKGKTIEDFKNFNDRNMSSKEFINALIYTLHPFEIKKYVKIISPTQKAITMCIYMHGGYASETDIIDFLTRHWNEITAVSKHNFARKPDSPLLHKNMKIKKRGLYIFVKSPDDPLMIGVNNENSTEVNDYVSDDSAQEDIQSIRSRDRTKKNSADDAEANNSDSSVPDIDIGKDDDDNDDLKYYDYPTKSRRGGGRMRGRQRTDSYSSENYITVRETRSKKDKKVNYYSDEKDKQSQESASNSSDYNSGTIKSSDYHYGRGSKRFNLEPINQTPSLSSAVPVKSIGSSINLMKINSTLILPPIQKVPPQPFSLNQSKKTEEKDDENENKDPGWCNFSMSTAERILFFPLSKPLESSADSIQNDERFDFSISEDLLSFEEIVVFVVNQACSRALALNSSADLANCGITIEQIIEKVRSFQNADGMFASLPLNKRVRAVLLEAKELKLVDREFIGKKELWLPKKLMKKRNEKTQGKFKFVMPKPFASMKIRESNITISQVYERFAQDQFFGLKCTEFLP